MLIFDDKYFVELETYIRYSNGSSFSYDQTLTFYMVSNYEIYDGKDYYNVPDVRDVLNFVLDWRLNRGDFANDTVDILDKRSWYIYRSYKTIERIKKGIIE